MKISFNKMGDWSDTKKFLNKTNRINNRILSKYGDLGVNALQNATPTDSGQTANSWEYTIEVSSGSAVLAFDNTNINDGVNIAIILQYGHGTGTGGYVQGRDYINPAIQPVFDRLADEAWKEIMNG